jgi:monoamine oxidase
MTPHNPSRRQLLAMIGQVAGAAAMYQAMTSLGFAADSGYTGEVALQGPRQGRRILILGAGIAGMTAAYEMRRAGYEVKILEYQNRTGGRCLTLRGGDRYTEMGGHEIACDFEGDGYLNTGPWRLPVHHRAVFDYCRKLGVPVHPFIIKNNKAYLHSAHAFDGKPQRIGHVEKDMRGHVSELLAKSLHQGSLDDTVSAEDREKLLEGLKGWGVLDRNYAYRASDDVGGVRGWDIPPGGGLMPDKSPSQPVDLSVLLQSGLWEQLFAFNGYTFEPPMFEPAGGMDAITDAFAREVSDVTQLNARVTRIAQSDNGVTVTYEDGGRGGAVREETATGASAQSRFRFLCSSTSIARTRCARRLRRYPTRPPSRWRWSSGAASGNRMTGSWAGSAIPTCLWCRSPIPTTASCQTARRYCRPPMTPRRGDAALPIPGRP